MTGSASLDAVLTERFGFAGFRPGQRELVETVLAGRDALGILPTGGGKSLTYQLPATLRDGLTLVVSPLIALMTDQVDAFNRRGLGRAVAIHSNLPAGAARAALDQARSGAARLLYVAPERLEIAEWRERLREARPRLLVIDEAHCVSQWGYDFRPSYLALRDVAARVRPCAVLALTATATPAVRTDIVRQLGLRDPLVFVAPFDRPNLRFEVVPCGFEDKSARLVEILRSEGAGGSRIVYVGRRRDAEDVAGRLAALGLPAVAYHAGLTAAERREAQESWLSGRRSIVVATVAFGMGIDKPDVRTVVHWQHPSSLEAYYQEAGRAGRDGAPARCVVLFSGQDVGLHHYFLEQRYPAREDVRRLLREIPEDGTSAEAAAHLGGWLTAEQRHVALFALVEEGLVARDADGGLRRVAGAGTPRRPSLAGLEARRAADYARLDAMVAYCRDRRCQRRRLLEYFGEALPAGFRCGNCSACGRRGMGVAEADPAATVLAAVRQAYPHLVRDSPLSARRLGQFLRGARGRRMPAAWRELPGFGLMAGLSRDESERRARQLLRRLDAERPPEREPETQPVAAGAPATAGAAPEPGPVERAGTAAAPTSMAGSRSRPLPREALITRPVPRPVGLAILELLASAGPLPASGIANVLLGSRRCDVVQAQPALAGSSLFGSIRDRGYADLVADARAMEAKGFLAVASDGRRLDVSEPGRRVLAGGRRTP